MHTHIIGRALKKGGMPLKVAGAKATKESFRNQWHQVARVGVNASNNNNDNNNKQ